MNELTALGFAYALGALPLLAFFLWFRSYSKAFENAGITTRIGVLKPRAAELDERRQRLLERLEASKATATELHAQGQPLTEKTEHESGAREQLSALAAGWKKLLDEAKELEEESNRHVAERKSIEDEIAAIEREVKELSRRPSYWPFRAMEFLTKTARRTAATASVAFFGLAIVGIFAAPWWFTLQAAANGVASGLFTPAARRTAHYYEVLPAVLAFALITAFTSGLAPANPRVVQIHFHASQIEAHGEWFLLLGRTDEVLYIRRCSPAESPIWSMRTAEVSRIVFAPPGPPPAEATIAQILAGTSVQIGQRTKGCSLPNT